MTHILSWNTEGVTTKPVVVLVAIVGSYYYRFHFSSSRFGWSCSIRILITRKDGPQRKKYDLTGTLEHFSGSIEWHIT